MVFFTNLRVENIVNTIFTFCLPHVVQNAVNILKFSLFFFMGAICLQILLGLSISVRKRGKEEKGKRRNGGKEE